MGYNVFLSGNFVIWYFRVMLLSLNRRIVGVPIAYRALQNYSYKHPNIPKAIIKISQYLRTVYILLFQLHKINIWFNTSQILKFFCITIIANKCTFLSVFNMFFTHTFVTNILVFMTKIITIASLYLGK